MASIAITQKFEKGYKICKEGQMASAMYIVKSGRIQRTIDGVSVGHYLAGDSFE